MLLRGRTTPESENWHVFEPIEIKVLGRIAGGTGAIAVSFHADYSQTAHKAQVYSIYESNAYIKR
jgi:hypothetical protein